MAPHPNNAAAGALREAHREVTREEGAGHDAERRASDARRAVEVALGGSRRNVPGGDDLERNSNPLVRGALYVGRLAQTVMSEQRAYLEGRGVQTQITATPKNYSVFELNARAGQIGQRVSSYGRDIRPTDILYSMGDFFGSMLGYAFNEKTGTLHMDTEKFMRRSKLQLNPEYTQPTFVDASGQITRHGL